VRTSSAPKPNVQSAYSIETFAWDRDGNLLIKTYYPMPEDVGADSDPYGHLLESQQDAGSGWAPRTSELGALLHRRLSLR
jgi:hypothetical protein